MAFGNKSVIKSMDVYRHISRLKILKSMPEDQVNALFKLFLDAIKTDEQITEVKSNSIHSEIKRPRGKVLILSCSFYPSCPRTKAAFYLWDSGYFTLQRKCEDTL